MRNYHDSEYVRLGMAFFSIILILGAFLASGAFIETAPHRAVSVSEPSDSYPPYIRDFQIFRELFNEPFEVLAVIFSDWTGFAITTREEDQISVAESFLVEQVKKRGKGLADIFAIVHNHNDPSRFSEQNNHFYFYLKRQGFDGFFYIYYPHSGRVLEKK